MFPGFTALLPTCQPDLREHPAQTQRAGPVSGCTGIALIERPAGLWQGALPPSCLEISVLQRWSLPLLLSLLVHGALLAWLASRPAGEAGASIQVLQVHVAAVPAQGGVAPDSGAPALPSGPDRPVDQAVSEQLGPRAEVADDTPELPEAGATGTDSGKPDSRWQQQLRHHLQDRMQYPRAARLRQQQGVAELMFELDGEGRLLTLALARSSGFELLDQEALALVRRAAPLPVPPAAAQGESWQIRVPIRFQLN